MFFFCCLAGTLSLGDFKQVFDVSQHSALHQSGKLHSNFKQRNKHTWLYQGPGSHHVLQTLRNRLLFLPPLPQCNLYTCILKLINFFFFCFWFPRIISLSRLPSPLVELSEPLQVVRYELRDFSDAHYDSSPSHSETTCSHTRLTGNSSALTEVSCR